MLHAGHAAEGPHFFPDDTLTDQPERVIAAEIIREKVLRNMRDEIPHGTAVAIERMQERQGRDLMDIDATIYCERESHKGMIIGKKGAMLKKHRHPGPGRISKRFLGSQGQPAVLGQGQGGLAQPGGPHQKLWLVDTNKRRFAAAWIFRLYRNDFSAKLNPVRYNLAGGEM